MKKYILLLFLVTQSAIAQDIIVLKDNSTILSKILEINSTEVKYKKDSNLNGPTYTVNKSKIAVINFENGEKESFELEMKNVDSLPLQCMSDNKSMDNDSLIGMHNKIPKFASLKRSKKKAKKFFPIMAMSENSIISTREIEMRLVPECVADYDFNNRYRLKYYIRLRNKTDKIIYIDKAKCFRKDNNDALTPFFDSKQISVSIGNHGGIGTFINNGMGNISAGGGTSNLQTSTYSQQRFIYIPPYSEVNLSEYVYDEIRKLKTVFTKNHKIIFDIETWDFTLYGWNGTLHKDEVVECDEVDSPYKTEYHIIYSTDKDFETFSVLNAKLYTKYLVGRDYNSWTEVFSFDRIRNIIPNFWGTTGGIDILIGQPNRAKLPNMMNLLVQ